MAEIEPRSEGISILLCLEATKFVLPSVFYSYRDVVSLAAALVSRGALRDETKTAAMETNRDDQAENLVKVTA